MSNNVDSYTSSSEYSNDEPSTWISWFCEQPQNSFFCEIDYQYIDSTFNLFGLKKEVRRFNYCREIIIEELDSSASECSSGVPPEWGNHGSADLYGRIHVRYLNTAQGQRAMTAKFLRGQFGHCPLYSCKNQKVLPIGMSDVVGQCPVKVYCPRCQDVYDTPRSGLDGAFFGRTFLPFLLLCAPELIPKDAKIPVPRFQPTVFGYRIHKSSPYWTRRLVTKKELQQAEEAAKKKELAASRMATSFMSDSGEDK
eukprot:CAMPEP_0195507974 /NCGR_PEP_ID=MMETSP0794_2-20130614/1302_1 /TAXON_ID=515487 /ORGANISM="Stephanopyxis turris, Strain CCMP 815" /LENGTH=252 /DNA_ID=CAMNT_0040634815 /DNA_START=111 /DNA_END=866 /DNA_ORIENTATION=-